jgi:hypothetical protein
MIVMLSINTDAGADADEVDGWMCEERSSWQMGALKMKEGRTGRQQGQTVVLAGKRKKPCFVYFTIKFSFGRHQIEQLQLNCTVAIAMTVCILCYAILQLTQDKSYSSLLLYVFALSNCCTTMPSLQISVIFDEMDQLFFLLFKSNPISLWNQA